jgi:hypothetical protein
MKRAWAIDVWWAGDWSPMMRYMNLSAVELIVNDHFGLYAHVL